MNRKPIVKLALVNTCLLLPCYILSGYALAHLADNKHWNVILGLLTYWIPLAIYGTKLRLDIEFPN
jgi:hypothetical protein